MADGKFFLRLALLGVLIVASFAYPILWLVVIFGFGAILDGGRGTSSNAKPEPNRDFQTLVKRHVSATDPQWRQNLEKRCESPAEVAFLNAAIDAFGLRPEEGVLQGSGLHLDLQVDMPPYRADFVAQGWLVIEIDGAEWHSSAEAIERDRERDVVMQKRGLRVLRLPAKLVFRTPDEAIARMRAALEASRPAVQQRAETPPKQTPKSSLAKVGFLMGEINAGAQRLRAIRAAMSAPESTFALEKRVVDSAINSAKRSIEVDDQIGNNETRRQAYMKSHDELTSALERFDRQHEGNQTREKRVSAIVIPRMTAPSKHETAEINDAIERTYRLLLMERHTYLLAQQERLRNEPRLCELAKKNLAELGCPNVWGLVAPPSKALPELHAGIARQHPSC